MLGKMQIGDYSFLGDPSIMNWTGYGRLYHHGTKELVYEGSFKNKKYDGLGLLKNDSMTYSGRFSEG